MSAVRTQVYFTRDQRRRLDERARREGKTLAQVVREAVDRYDVEQSPSVSEALEATFGSLPEIKVPPRSEWDRGYG